MAKVEKPAGDAKAGSLARRLRLAANDNLRRRLTAELVAIGKGAVPALIGLLDDRSPKVRLCAVQALGKIGDARALHPLQAIREKAERRAEGDEIGEAAREAARIIYQKNK